VEAGRLRTPGELDGERLATLDLLEETLVVSVPTPVLFPTDRHHLNIPSSILLSHLSKDKKAATFSFL
jgi:hypothetical protein